MSNISNVETFVDKPYHFYIFPIISIFQELKYKTVLSRSELIDEVIKLLQIPESELSKVTSTNTPLIYSRIGWGISYAKIGGYIETPQRGYYKLTIKGNEINKAEDLNKFWLIIANNIKNINKESINTENKTKNNEETALTLDSFIESNENTINEKIINYLNNLSPTDFERFCMNLLSYMNVSNLQHMGKTGDKGIDIEGYLITDNFLTYYIAFQCKKYNDKVGSREIREFAGSYKKKYDKGVIITTAIFTESAKVEAKEQSTSLTLIDGNELVTLIKQYSGFVKQKTIEIEVLDEQAMNNFLTYK